MQGIAGSSLCQACPFFFAGIFFFLCSYSDNALMMMNPLLGLSGILDINEYGLIPLCPRHAVFKDSNESNEFQSFML